MTEIERIATKVLGIGYLYEDNPRANLRIDQLDKSEFPILLETVPLSGVEKISNGTFRDVPNRTLWFLDRMKQLDFDTDENTERIEAMKSYMMRFIKEVNNGGIYEPISADINYHCVISEYDDALTGISIDISLTPIIPTCIDNA
jgi:hypothetical protein